MTLLDQRPVRTQARRTARLLLVDGEAIDTALRGVEITMRAEVGDTHMSVEDVLALRPGDVVTLDGKAADGVTLFADAVPVHRARPGRSGARRGVQVIGPVDA